MDQAYKVAATYHYWQYDELLERREEVTYKDSTGALFTTGVVVSLELENLNRGNLSEEDGMMLLDLDRSVVEICKLWLERHAQRHH